MPKIYANNATLISPLECDSLIAYKITREEYYFNASMTLSDCNRMVTWSFEKDDRGIDKIDAALGILMEFRKELIKAQKDNKRLDAIKAKEDAARAAANKNV